MKASERKRLIDRILGLTAQEKAEKDCKDEAKGHRKLAEVLADNLVKPELPERPVGYRTVSAHEGELVAEQDYEKEKARLDAVLDKEGEEPAVHVAENLEVGVLEGRNETARTSTQAQQQRTSLQER